MKTLLIAVSLAANLALAVFAFQPSLAPPAFRDFFRRGSGPAEGAARPSSPSGTKTAAKVATTPPKLWATLQSDDLPGLVDRLRAAGFPIWAIRAVIQAQVDARYLARLRELTQPDPDAPFWKSTPSMGMDPKRMAEYLRLSSERSKLLRDLLGNFALRDDGDVTSAQRRRYGDLPSAKIDSIQRVDQDYSEMTAQVRAAMNGITLPADREKLALLDKEKHADLAEILTPQELEDYDMRNSLVTARLRPALAFFNATEDEFHTIYKIQQAFADQLYPTTPVMAQQRTAAAQEVADQLKAALGDQRYADFERSSDRDYQQLAQLEQSENLPTGTAVQAYNLRDSLSQESNRIFNDATLNVDQKRAALQSLAQSTRTQLLATLGPTAGDAYIRTANSWLGSVERGGAVTFSATTTQFRSLPPARPPAVTGAGGGGAVLTK